MSIFHHSIIFFILISPLTDIITVLDLKPTSTKLLALSIIEYLFYNNYIVTNICINKSVIKCAQACTCKLLLGGDELWSPQRYNESLITMQIIMCAISHMIIPYTNNVL